MAAPQMGTATVYVDYAHTPDALAKVLEAVRPWLIRGVAHCAWSLAVAEIGIEASGL